MGLRLVVNEDDNLKANNISMTEDNVGKFYTYYEPVTRIRRTTINWGMAAFVLVILFYIAAIIISYFFAEEMLLPLVIIGIFFFFLVMFFYISFGDIWYKVFAFSHNDNSELYLYNINSMMFLSAFGLRSYMIEKRRYRSRGVISALFLTYKEKNGIKKLLDVVAQERCFDKIVSNGIECRTGIKINRIVAVNIHKKYTDIIFTVVVDNESKEEISDSVRVYKNIPDYDYLIDLCQIFMHKNKYLCARCGSVMVDGFCPVCGGNTYKKERKVSDKICNIIIGVCVFLEACVGILYAINNIFLIAKILNIVCFAILILFMVILMMIIEYKNSKPHVKGKYEDFFDV